MKNSRQKGFTLIEVMTVCLLMVFLTTILFNFALGSARYVERIEGSQTVMTKMRQATQKFSTDVSESSAVLSQYPILGAAVHITNYADTVVLRVPKFDSSGDILTTTFDVVIYKLEAAPNTQTGPFVLRKYTAIVTNTNQPTATLNATLATNISSIAFNYIANETFTGDDNNKVFNLSAVPLTKTIERPLQVLIGGKDRLADGKAILNGSQITFRPLAPARAIPIDVVYTLNPASSGSTGRITPTKIVSFEITTDIKWRNTKQVQKTRNQVVSGRATLLNR